MSRDKVGDYTCAFCGIIFRGRRDPTSSKHYCCLSHFKQASNTNPIKSYDCANCGKEVIKRKDPDCLNVFCNSSCAASFNNIASPKRFKTKQCKTNDCKNLVLSGWTYCEDCWNKHAKSSFKPVYDENNLIINYINPSSSRSKQDICNINTTSCRYNKIRLNAKAIYKVSEKPRECIICGYDKHIEICHIKDIASFPITATLAEINHISNLAACCPVHHWEFDHGFLSHEDYFKVTGINKPFEGSKKIIKYTNGLMSIANKTLLEASGKKNDSNKYGHIRQHARKAYYLAGLPDECFVCGYSLHTELCHIKKISSFPLDTLVSVINSPENMIRYCKNHHWEHDNLIPSQGLEP